MAPLLVIAILCSSLSILLIKNNYACNGHVFSAAKRLSSRSLVGSTEGEESFQKVIYSTTFFNNLVVSWRNLRALFDKLLWFRTQGSVFCFWSYRCWGQTCWSGCPFTFASCTVFVLGGLQDLSGSSPERPGQTPELTLLGQEVWPETFWGSFPPELLCNLMTCPLA